MSVISGWSFLDEPGFFSAQKEALYLGAELLHCRIFWDHMIPYYVLGVEFSGFGIRVLGLEVQAFWYWDVGL